MHKLLVLALCLLVAACTAPCAGDPSTQCSAIDWGSFAAGASIGNSIGVFF